MAITPPARSASVRLSSLFSAPRSLNEAVNCRFSNFSQTSQPAMADRVRDCRIGVRITCPSIAAAACWMSFSVTELSNTRPLSGFGGNLGRALAHVGVQLALAQANRFRRHLDQLVVADIGN